MVALHLSAHDNVNLERELRWRCAKSSATSEDSLEQKIESSGTSEKPVRHL